MKIAGRKALVLGAGQSGIVSAKFLAERGAIVALHDKKKIEDWSKESRSLKSKYGIGLIDREIPSWLLDQIESGSDFARCSDRCSPCEIC